MGNQALDHERGTDGHTQKNGCTTPWQLEANSCLVGTCELPPTHAENLAGFVLCRSYTENHRCYLFVSAAAFSCLMTAFHSTPFHLLTPKFFSFFLKVLPGLELSVDTDVPLKDEQSYLFILSIFTSYV